MAEPATSVVSTKALTLQLAVLACLAIVAARARHAINRNCELGLSASLIDVPGRPDEMLTSNHRLREIAQEFAKTQEALLVERGVSYPIALEGAVKLREITDIYIYICQGLLGRRERIWLRSPDC
jgi:glucosamine--fructose-6-phosphate aminotransferase (isomerizing)